jgi:hypothetical protein
MGMDRKMKILRTAAFVCVVYFLSLLGAVGAGDLKIDLGKLEWSEWTDIKFANKGSPKSAPNFQVAARFAWADYPGKVEDANAVLVIQFKGVNLGKDLFQVVGHYKLPPEIVPAFANLKMSYQRVFIVKGPKLGDDVTTVKLPLKVNKRMSIDKIRLTGMLRSCDFVNVEMKLETDSYDEDKQTWSRKPIGNQRNK